MSDTVDQALEERRKRSRGGGVVGVLTSLALHGGLVASALLVPGLFAEEPKPLDYVPVMLVPPPAVGVENPAPAEPARREPEPEPEPAPEPVEPEPVSDVPVLPDEKPKPKEEPKPEPPKPKPEPRPKAPEPQPDRPPAEPTPGPSEGLPGPKGSPTGDPGSSFTQGAAVLGVEDPSFTYGYYLDRLVVAVKSQWVRPPLGSGIQAVVHFRIQEDGSIEGVRIAQSSGYNSFDLAALRAVQAAAPLPPLPRSYQKGSLGVNLIFQ